MNRTFLLFLMIGTAMMIAVIGQHESAAQLDTMPWEVDRLENDTIRVFGITLTKTTIQESNQILAQFGQTLLEVNTNTELKSQFKLSSTYNELVIGGLIAQIQITYQLDQENLQHIYDSISIEPRQSGTQIYTLSNDIQMQYLNTPVATLTYIPSVDYGMDTLRQNFGQATEEVSINENEKIWSYPEMDLKIYIHKNEPDQFIYSPLN